MQLIDTQNINDPLATKIVIVSAHRKAIIRQDDGIDALNAWLAEAGLRGESEAALLSGFCERAVAAGLPISRALMLIDTLHPVYEGRVVRWGHDPSQPAARQSR